MSYFTFVQIQQNDDVAMFVRYLDVKSCTKFTCLIFRGDCGQAQYTHRETFPLNSNAKGNKNMSKDQERTVIDMSGQQEKMYKYSKTCAKIILEGNLNEKKE